MSNLSVGIAVITHNAKHHLPHCLPPLIGSPLKPRVLVMNSSSQDGTADLARELGAEVCVSPRNEFNHGSTREKARQILACDIIVMTTPDAYATDPHVIERLIAPLKKGDASASYGRQLPHKGADFFESFPRSFNYPATSHIRGLKDRKQWGAYTYFCSDSLAAYLNEALEEVDGFPSVLTAEDMMVVAKLLKKGHKIAYVADATVQHSHRYGLRDEFKRHFDTGIVRKEAAQWIQDAGRDEGRGLLYVKELVRQLAVHKPYLLPYAFLQTASKLLGYRLGRASTRAPDWWKKRLSGQDFYWSSKDYLDKKATQTNL
jgi:rhamnosyltransferase